MSGCDTPLACRRDTLRLLRGCIAGIPAGGLKQMRRWSNGRLQNAFVTPASTGRLLDL